MAICLNSQCGHDNPDGNQFCEKCGSEMMLLGRYRALRILGEGGFGKTYLAQDEAKPSKPSCVIKQFIYVGPAQVKATELFEAEAAQLDKLGKHPQIPELYAHCQQNGQQFLVQEFIDGQDLEKELKTEGTFDEVKIRALLLDLLPVLDFIHQNQVIHRDIKPANIIRRRRDGKLVLVDFGAAKQATVTALKKTGTFIGSAGYTSPEQMQGRAVFASDIYSLGVTCLHLLTGMEPFNLKNLDDEWVWRDYQLAGRRVGSELGTVLDRVLLPVSKRYTSAKEVLQELTPPTVLSTAPKKKPLPQRSKVKTISPSAINTKMHKEGGLSKLVVVLGVLILFGAGFTGAILYDRSRLKPTEIVTLPPPITPSLPGRPETTPMPSPSPTKTPETPLDSPTIEMSLVSQTTGTDYSELDRALRNRQWKEADELTRTLMMNLVSTANPFLTYEIGQFPSEDLKLINKLWANHSNGTLGFSVQKRILQECGSPGYDDETTWKECGQRLGWRPGGTGYDQWRHLQELDYSNPTRHPGHLPARFCGYGVGTGGGRGGCWALSILAQRSEL